MTSLSSMMIWKFVIDDDMDPNTATESNLSLRSRSFLNRVNDRLRKMLNHLPEDARQDIDKRHMIWRMFMSSTLEASVFMGKNYSDNLHSIKNTGEDLTLKQMFNISEKLILEQANEILGVCQIRWKILHGNNYLWSMMKKSSVSRMQRLMLSLILCYVLERWTQNQILLGNSSWVCSKIHHNTELWTQLTENRWNSSGIFPSSSKKSKSSWTKWANPNNSKDELSSCRCSMTSYGEWKTMKRNVLPIPHLCLYLQKDFQQDVGHSSDLDQKQSGMTIRRMGQSRWVDDDQI